MSGKRHASRLTLMTWRVIDEHAASSSGIAATSEAIQTHHFTSPNPEPARRASVLVLTRMNGESLVINPGRPDQITVQIVAIQSRKVRIAIIAPREILVLRSELLEEGDADGHPARTA